MLDFLMEGLFNLFGKGVAWALDAIMNSFNTTPEQFRQIIPVLERLPSVLSSIGWSMLILILVLSVIKSMMTPNDQTAEHPLAIVGRTVIAGIFLLSYESLFDMFFQWGTVMYEAIGEVSTDPGTSYASPFSHFVETFTMDGIAGVAADAATTPLVGSGVTALVGLIMLLMMSYQIIKFMLECLERFVTLHMTVYFAPLVAPTLGSKATTVIFSSYLSFVVGQMMLWWMSMLFMKLIVSGFDAFGRAGDSVGFFMRCFVLYSLIVLAQKADNILARIGFKNILGGAGTASSFMIAMLVAGQTAMKAISAIRGGKGHNPNGDGRNDRSGAEKPAYDAAKDAENGGTARIAPMPGSESQVPPASVAVNQSAERANAAKQSSVERMAKAETLRQEAETAREALSKETAENGAGGSNVIEENGAPVTEEENNTVQENGGPQESSTVQENDAVQENSSTQQVDSLVAQSEAMESLANADSSLEAAYLASEAGNTEAYKAAMEESRSYITSAAETYADQIREGGLSEIPPDSNLTIGKDGTTAIYSPPDQPPVSAPIDPYAFMPKADAQQVGAASADAINNIQVGKLDKGTDPVARGYQSVVSAHQNNAAAVDASIRGDHAMAREFYTRAQNDMRTAASQFNRGGAEGYEAAKNAGITMQTHRSGGVSYTSTGPIKTSGGFRGPSGKVNRQGGGRTRPAKA